MEERGQVLDLAAADPELALAAAVDPDPLALAVLVDGISSCSEPNRDGLELIAVGFRSRFWMSATE